MKKNLTRIIVIVSFLFVPFFVLYANGITCEPPGTICNPIPSITSVPGLIQLFLTTALKIGMPIIALAIIYCGFLFVSAQGKPEAITKAKSALMYTLIGAAILLGSWAIAKLISDTVIGLS